jgi:hypothetical protein
MLPKPEYWTLLSYSLKKIIKFIQVEVEDNCFLNASPDEVSCLQLLQLISV